MFQPHQQSRHTYYHESVIIYITNTQEDYLLQCSMPAQNYTKELYYKDKVDTKIFHTNFRKLHTSRISLKIKLCQSHFVYNINCILAKTALAHKITFNNIIVVCRRKPGL